MVTKVAKVLQSTGIPQDTAVCIASTKKRYLLVYWFYRTPLIHMIQLGRYSLESFMLHVTSSF